MTLQKTFHLASPQPRNSIHWFLDLLIFKTNCNLKSEVQRNYLSYLWWVLEPLLYMMVYYIVFGLLLKRGSENFIVFLLTGLIPWMWFSKAIAASTNSIISVQTIITQIKIPLIIFPLITVLQSTIKQIPVFILLICFVSLQGYPPDIHWWTLIPVIFVQILLISFISCSAAAITPFIRDIAYIVPTSLILLMFLSGVFYDYRDIDPEWQQVFLMNPIAFLLTCYRRIIIEGIPPNMGLLLTWGAIVSVLFSLIFVTYQKLNKTIPRAVLG